MSVTLEAGITVGAGIGLGPVLPAPVLKLSLDAAGYTSGPWVDSVASRSFTLYGGASYSADGGGSLSFVPSSGQYAECTSSLSDLSTWTVIAWHYYAGTNTSVAPCIITEVFPGVTSNINYTLGCDASGGGNTRLRAGFFNGLWRTTPYTTLTAGNWYQIVGTYDGTTVKLYVNNTLVQSASQSGTPISSGAGIRLMSRWDNADYWGGKLAIVQVYENAMDASGVSADWSTNKTRFGL